MSVAYTHCMENENIDLENFREVFNERFSIFWEKVLAENAYVPIAHALLLQCRNISNGGKRLRPYIAYIGYLISISFDDESKNDDYNLDIIDRLIGLELFHLYALVHDDIIDSAYTRHGVPTIQVAMAQSATERNVDANEKVHLGQSYAILAGDLLFGIAQKVLLLGTGLGADTSIAVDQKRIANLFSQMAEEVILGQMIDVELSTQDRPPLESIELKNLMKTARYTFVYPFKIGAALSGTSHPEYSNNLPEDYLNVFEDTYYSHDSLFESIGTDLGVAYQIYDDIADLVSDVRSFQHNNLTHYVFSGGSPYSNLKHAQLLELEDDMILNHFKDAGAIDHCLSICEQKMRNAKDQIDQSSVGTRLKKILLKLINDIRPKP